MTEIWRMLSSGGEAESSMTPLSSALRLDLGYRLASIDTNSKSIMFRSPLSAMCSVRVLHLGRGCPPRHFRDEVCLVHWVCSVESIKTTRVSESHVFV